MDFVHSVLPHIVGGIASFLIIFSFQFKDMRRLLFFQIASSALFGLQFVLLGAFSGALTNLVGVFLRVVVYRRAERGALPGETEDASPFRSPWAWGFVLLFLAAAVLSCDGLLSLLPPVSMILFVFAVWRSDPLLLRRLNLFVCSPMWLAYNLFTHAWAGVVTETFVMLSIVVSFLRFFFRKKT
ncbi:MAG: YgjV family protein [Clostridia bacterium]|nr:YgjV family protein [Clostridia bacterium]